MKDTTQNILIGLGVAAFIGIYTVVGLATGAELPTFDTRKDEPRDLDQMDSWDKRSVMETSAKAEAYKTALEAIKNDTTMDAKTKQRMMDDIIRKIGWL